MKLKAVSVVHTKMNDLPDDLLDIVFSHLNAKTIARAECCCKRFRDAGQRADLQIHATPSNVDSLVTWARTREHRVTKVSLRRLRYTSVFNIVNFPRLVSIQARFCTVAFPWTPVSSLRRLELGRITRGYGQYPNASFNTSDLPAGLEKAVLTFDSTWHSVVVDRAFPHMEIKGAPQIVLQTLESVVHLTLETLQAVYVDPEIKGRVSTARIESVVFRFNVSLLDILGVLGPDVDTLVLSMPLASMAWSEAPACLNPRVLALDLDFLAMDVVPSRLEVLEIRVDRLASVRIPAHVQVWGEVRGVEVARSFFD